MRQWHGQPLNKMYKCPVLIFTTLFFVDFREWFDFWLYTATAISGGTFVQSTRKLLGDIEGWNDI